MYEGPVFASSAINSSSHAEYKPRAIQIHGRPKFEAHTAHQARVLICATRTPVMPASSHIPALKIVYRGEDAAFEHLYTPSITCWFLSWIYLQSGCAIVSWGALGRCRMTIRHGTCQIPRLLARCKESDKSCQFDASTAYANDYPAHPLQPRIRREAPVYRGECVISQNWGHSPATWQEINLDCIVSPNIVIKQQ